MTWEWIPDRLHSRRDWGRGGLAPAVALLARDRGGPQLFGQLLGHPMLDDRNDAPSSLQMTGVDVWDSASNQTGWDALLGQTRGTPNVSLYAAPARATDMAGLPPTFVDVGSAATFRDEAVAYAGGISRLHGGEAELHVWPVGPQIRHLDATSSPVTRHGQGTPPLAATAAGLVARRYTLVI